MESAPNLTPSTRGIILGLIAVLGLAVLALAASAVIPFNVHQEARYRTQNATPEHGPYDTLAVGQRLNIAAEDAADILFFNGGSAHFSGPAAITLAESHRRATSLGHLTDSDRFTRRYVLTVEQTGGLAAYNFANANPPFDAIDLTIRLPSGSYTPTAPCWQIAVHADGTFTANAIPCP